MAQTLRRQSLDGLQQPLCTPTGQPSLLLLDGRRGEKIYLDHGDNWVTGMNRNRTETREPRRQTLLYNTRKPQASNSSQRSTITITWCQQAMEPERYGSEEIA